MMCPVQVGPSLGDNAVLTHDEAVGDILINTWRQALTCLPPPCPTHWHIYACVTRAAALATALCRNTPSTRFSSGGWRVASHPPQVLPPGVTPHGCWDVPLMSPHGGWDVPLMSLHGCWDVPLMSPHGCWDVPLMSPHGGWDVPLMAASYTLQQGLLQHSEVTGSRRLCRRLGWSG